MLKNDFFGAFCICMLLLASLTNGRYLDDDDEENTRVKRQVAESKLGHLLALLELERRLAAGCETVGCGLIDIHRFYKRSWSDQRLAEIKAEIALQGLGDPNLFIAHGLVDPIRILSKRTASDQRMAELMALIALSRGGGVVGHGRVDPKLFGRRKRSAISEQDKHQVIKSLLGNAKPSTL